MKKILLACSIFSCFALTSQARNPDVVVNRTGGVLGHYDRITSDHSEQDGQTMDVLNCSDPGWYRCLFKNAVPGKVVIVGTLDVDNYLDDIFTTVDAEIANNSTGGSFTTAQNALEVQWTGNASSSQINIFNNP